ncbi:MAG: HAD family hydrolase [Akkermansiaceae bacterium]|nr:HAD family hydrolase [Akkermansiaceae bacterium]
MHVAIVHYHAGHGGVVEVIRAISRMLEEADVRHIVLTGSWPDEPTRGMPVSVVPGLAYGGDRESPGILVEKLRGAARAALGTCPDLWHFHNHSLGKNNTMHELAALLAAENERLLLHIHDLAEDGRPENALHLASSRALYPSGPRVHYAFLNRRDRDCFLDAGLSESRAHLLPNPVDARSQASVEASAAPILLYPVRGIRRKNLGEFLLLAALAPHGTRGAVTRAPRNPEARSIHDGWQRFARECGIDVGFDVVGRVEPVAHAGSDFESWCDHATHFVSTSVSEGFGMVFPESIACGKPLLGRKLPHLDADHAAHGIRFPGLYDRLLVPAGWVDPAILGYCLHDAAGRLWSAWRREAPAAGVIHARLERGGMLDFGNLPEVLQQRVIRKALEPGMKSRPMVGHGGNTEPAAAWLVENLARRAPAATPGHLTPHAPAVYQKSLIRIYQGIQREAAVGTGVLDSGKILDSCLTPGRFHFLTSPAPARRPPPDFHSFRAIIFDIYGTLLTAPSGGVRPDAAADPALREIISRFGHHPPDSPSSELHAAVMRHHAESAVPCPEIDLRGTWREVLSLPPETDTTALVIETEAAWHPARLMPGAALTVQSLAAAGIPLGLLSNAQCNTLPSLAGLTKSFADDLLILSYQHGVAKPSPVLFELLAARLAARGIMPDETLYIGNDPLHDIDPAVSCGFQTALFTGDPDSLRAGACFPDYEIRAWPA